MEEVLNKFLRHGAKFYPAANSLKFHSNRTGDKNYLWIEPPWRILKGTRVIASSFTCPWYEDFDTDEEYTRAFREWCESMAYLNKLEIKRHSIGSIVNDLLIEWVDGSTLEVFQKREEDDAWYITDDDHKKYHKAFPDRIEIKEMK